MALGQHSEHGDHSASPSELFGLELLETACSLDTASAAALRMARCCTAWVN